ncbi:hypothetical protein AB7008_41650 [Bradyrhizobium sp. 521_C7_N1_3]|uniref:hypothetical protein n=1 Tax=Bradyrhizobium sp. 521_C7_N1_3 TaxID=3240368 RepID=UPI003F89A6EC
MKLIDDEYHAVRNLLLPELRSSFRRTGHLHHPLVICLCLNSDQVVWYNETYQQKRDWLETARGTRDWRTFIYTHERPYRLEAFLAVYRELDDHQYWALLADVWTDSGNIWQSRPIWKSLWNSERAMKPAAMDEIEWQQFDALPDVITVYRGQPKRNARGMSWSLVRETAEWFAGKWRYCGEGWLLTATVKKRDVHAFKNDRNEQEIVADRFKVVSRECLDRDHLEAVLMAGKHKKAVKAFV